MFVKNKTKFLKDFRSIIVLSLVLIIVQRICFVGITFAAMNVDKKQNMIINEQAKYENVRITANITPVNELVKDFDKTIVNVEKTLIFAGNSWESASTENGVIVYHCNSTNTEKDDMGCVEMSVKDKKYMIKDFDKLTVLFRDLSPTNPFRYRIKLVVGDTDNEDNNIITYFGVNNGEFEEKDSGNNYFDEIIDVENGEFKEKDFWYLLARELGLDYDSCWYFDNDNINKHTVLQRRFNKLILPDTKMYIYFTMGTNFLGINAKLGFKNNLRGVAVSDFNQFVSKRYQHNEFDVVEIDLGDLCKRGFYDKNSLLYLRTLFLHFDEPIADVLNKRVLKKIKFKRPMISPFSISIDDIYDWPSFSDKLKNNGGERQDIINRVRMFMSENERDIKKLEYELNNISLYSNRLKIIERLNKLIVNPEFYDSTTFNKVVLNEYAKSLKLKLLKQKINYADIIIFNRILVGSIFSGEIRRCEMEPANSACFIENKLDNGYKLLTCDLEKIFHNISSEEYKFSEIRDSLDKKYVIKKIELQLLGTADGCNKMSIDEVALLQSVNNKKIMRLFSMWQDFLYKDCNLFNAPGSLLSNKEYSEETAREIDLEIKKIKKKSCCSVQSSLAKKKDSYPTVEFLFFDQFTPDEFPKVCSFGSDNANNVINKWSVCTDMQFDLETSLNGVRCWFEGDQMTLSCKCNIEITPESFIYCDIDIPTDCYASLDLRSETQNEIVPLVSQKIISLANLFSENRKISEISLRLHKFEKHGNTFNDSSFKLKTLVIGSPFLANSKYVLYSNIVTKRDLKPIQVQCSMHNLAADSPPTKYFFLVNRDINDVDRFVFRYDIPKYLFLNNKSPINLWFNFSGNNKPLNIKPVFRKSNGFLTIPIVDGLYKFDKNQILESVEIVYDYGKAIDIEPITLSDANIITKLRTKRIIDILHEIKLFELNGKKYFCQLKGSSFNDLYKPSIIFDDKLVKLNYMDVSFFENPYFNLKSILIDTELPLHFKKNVDYDNSDLSPYKTIARLKIVVMLFVVLVLMVCSYLLYRIKFLQYFFRKIKLGFNIINKYYSRSLFAKCMFATTFFILAFIINVMDIIIGIHVLVVIGLYLLSAILRCFVVKYFPKIENFLYGRKSTVSFVGFLMSLVFSSFFIIIKHEPIAELIATIGYCFVVVGVVVECSQLYKENRSREERSCIGNGSVPESRP